MEPSIRLGRIAPTIPVSDIGRALNFYSEVFGLQSVFQNGNPVGFVILKRDDAELHLTLAPQHKGSSSNVAHLMVSDASALYDRCERLNVRIIKKLRDHDYGLRAFVIADPDGNRIDIGQKI
ncbi:MAG TPA: VOC family protein [Planctomycetota bacterium]|nr:VOC family protein [Planctomycetota bacterium]